MHARVFDTIFRATFETIALRALAGIAVLMTLHLVDSLVDRIVSSRGRAGPRSEKTSRDDERRLARGTCFSEKATRDARPDASPDP